MQRIDTNDGLYHDADPLNGVAGTVVKAAPLNSLQEEIIAVITAAGIVLDPAANDQLYQAILAVTGNGQIAWGSITGKPATYPPDAHTQDWSTITGKPESATRWPAWNEVTGKPATYPPSAHDQDWSTITGKPDNVTRWPTWSEVTGKPAFGTMASQDADNVNITGGTAALSSVSTSGNVTAGAKALLFTDAYGNAYLCQSDNQSVGLMMSYTGLVGVRNRTTNTWCLYVNADGTTVATELECTSYAPSSGAVELCAKGNNVYLRPNGRSNTSGQVTITPAGNMYVTGDVTTAAGKVLCASSQNVKVGTVTVASNASYDVQANYGNGLYVIYIPDGGGRVMGLFVTALLPGHVPAFTSSNEPKFNLGVGFTNTDPQAHTFDIYRWGG